jgi:hypothetical protein
MFLSNKARTAETAETTASFTRKFVRVGSVFAMLVIALCLLNACDKEDDEILPKYPLSGTSWITNDFVQTYDGVEYLLNMELQFGDTDGLLIGRTTYPVAVTQRESFEYTYDSATGKGQLTGGASFKVSGLKLTMSGYDFYQK